MNSSLITCKIEFGVDNFGKDTSIAKLVLTFEEYSTNKNDCLFFYFPDPPIERDISVTTLGCYVIVRSLKTVSSGIISWAPSMMRE